ncbi:hypothetical protein NDU88_004407 [Pleurodeles waltl]|uniref:Uncharacterized protein n=1 Tax=Pleurodeles waltl TaxID=8319 RepID=A0AAV7TSH2_PLEWA|nr:hypothetical protein NDU88_004407 [Pleurodeles waltl]
MGEALARPSHRTFFPVGTLGWCLGSPGADMWASLPPAMYGPVAWGGGFRKVPLRCLEAVSSAGASVRDVDLQEFLERVRLPRLEMESLEAENCRGSECCCGAIVEI